LRGVPASELPAELLDVVVRKFDDVYAVLPRDWEALRDEEGMAKGRPLPYWGRVWPAGRALARSLAADPPRRRARVLELGCGLALPSVVAARAGARVLATDGVGDAVAFAAHVLALNEVDAEVAHADWSKDGDALVARGPYDVILAADVLYTKANVETALRLLPRLLDLDGVIRLADPGRAGGRDFLAAARATFSVRTVEDGEVSLHTLRRR
jgi:predicted nicotinamide N-methyase